MQETETLHFAIYVILAVFCMTILSSSSRKDVDQNTVETYTPLYKKYVSEASKWATMASHETNPGIILMHISYAIACIDVAHNMADVADINAMFVANNTTLHEFDILIRNIQEAAVKKIDTTCPPSI